MTEKEQEIISVLEAHASFLEENAEIIGERIKKEQQKINDEFMGKGEIQRREESRKEYIQKMEWRYQILYQDITDKEEIKAYFDYIPDCLQDFERASDSGRDYTLFNGCMFHEKYIEWGIWDEENHDGTEGLRLDAHCYVPIRVIKEKGIEEWEVCNPNPFRRPGELMSYNRGPSKGYIYKGTDNIVKEISNRRNDFLHELKLYDTENGFRPPERR